MPTAKHATAETYRELNQAYDWFNDKLFQGKLPGALLTLARNHNTYGYFTAQRFVRRETRAQADEISLNPTYFAVVPIEEVLQTLVHEMVHQWQHHFGKPARGRYHNAQWANRMERLGLMPSDTGKPGGKRCGEFMCDYAIAGGAFEGVCRELLTSEFRLSWYDRFVAHVPGVFVPPPPTLPGPSSPTHSLIEVSMHLDADRDADNGEGDEDEDSIYSPEPWHPSIRDALVPPRPPGRRGEVPNSNRVKYTCPECTTNVWGKPELRIGCLQCDVAFVYASDLGKPTSPSSWHRGARTRKLPPRPQ